MYEGPTAAEHFARIIILKPESKKINFYRLPLYSGICKIRRKYVPETHEGQIPFTKLPIKERNKLSTLCITYHKECIQNH